METRLFTWLDQDYSQNLPKYQPKLHKNRHKCLYQRFSYLKRRSIANDRSRDRSCDYLAMFSLGFFGASSEPWRVTSLTSRALKLYDSKTTVHSACFLWGPQYVIMTSHDVKSTSYFFFFFFFLRHIFLMAAILVRHLWKFIAKMVKTYQNRDCLGVHYRSPAAPLNP